MRSITFFTIISVLFFIFNGSLNSQSNSDISELHLQIINNDIDSVKLLLEKDITLLNAPNFRGSTPLAVACSKGFHNIVQFLVKKGADINRSNDFGNSPLHYAAWAGDFDSFKFLVEKGSDLESKNSHGNIPIEYVCMGGNLELLHYCISLGLNIKSKTEGGAYLIHWAAYGGNLEMFKYLEANGLRYNESDADNSSTLFWAASGNSIDIIKYLVEEKKMDLNKQDDHGNVPLKSAVERGSLEVVQYFLENGASIDHKLEENQTWLLLASDNNNLQLIELLLKKGCDINVSDNYGNTPVANAAAHGNLEIVKLLAENGADLNLSVCKEDACNSSGQTPLHMASWRYPRIVEYLCEKGSNVNLQDLTGNAALHHAMWSDSTEIIDILVKNGAGIDMRNKYGETPLILAIKRNKMHMVKALLGHNADITVTDNNGKTPLHYAAVTGNDLISDLLLANNANLNALDRYENSPVYYALYYGNKDIAESLIKSGADNRNLPYKNTNLLKKNINPGEAIVWYLNHSGWAVKTENHLLIFDYWQRSPNPKNPSINNGRINPEEIKGENVMVFSSHTHGDHYSKEIFEWSKSLVNIDYILGFETTDFENYTYIPPGDSKTINDVKITTIKSTDSGEGFMVEADGVIIYHPGDHANRYREGDEEFFIEIDFLAENFNRIDIAFAPITGCSFRDKTALNIGNDYFVEQFKPSLVLPMHGSNNEQKYKEYCEERDQSIYKYVTNKGDRIFYRQPNI